LESHKKCVNIYDLICLLAIHVLIGTARIRLDEPIIDLMISSAIGSKLISPAIDCGLDAKSKRVGSAAPAYIRKIVLMRDAMWSWPMCMASL